MHTCLAVLSRSLLLEIFILSFIVCKQTNRVKTDWSECAAPTSNYKHIRLVLQLKTFVSVIKQIESNCWYTFTGIPLEFNNISLQQKSCDELNIVCTSQSPHQVCVDTTFLKQLLKNWLNDLSQSSINGSFHSSN